jgi:hypothetical protein
MFRPAMFIGAALDAASAVTALFSTEETRVR